MQQQSNAPARVLPTDASPWGANAYTVVAVTGGVLYAQGLWGLWYVFASYLLDLSINLWLVTSVRKQLVFKHDVVSLCGAMFCIALTECWYAGVKLWVTPLLV